MKKIILLVSALLLLSCGSKHKLIQEKEVKKIENIDSTGTRESIKVKDSVASSEELEWEWCPEDSSTNPLEIIQPDGTKVIIPAKGILRHKKKSSHRSVLEIEKDSASVKKVTSNETLESSREKEVEREPSIFPWLILIIVLVGIFLIIREWKRE